MMDYYIHWSDGYVETKHWCDDCDERQAQFFRSDESWIKEQFWHKTEHEQLCRQCWRKLVENHYAELT
jgi:hypothetical protein